MKYHKKSLFFTSVLLHICLLVLLVGIIYIPAFFGGFVSDDVAGILQNRNLGDFSYAFKNPLFSLRPVLYAAIYHLGGLNPFYFHIVSIFFHITTVLSLYLFVRLLKGSTLGFFTAALFASHPIATESVTWISAGSYPLYATFVFLCLSFYILSKKKYNYYWLSFISFLFALLASEKAVMLPLLLIALEILFYDLRKNWRKIVLYLVIDVSYLFVLFGNFQQRITLLYTDQSQITMIRNPLMQISIALTSYIRLLIWPDKLTLFHTDYKVLGFEWVTSIVTLFLFSILLFFAYKKSKNIFFWMLFFLISLFPTFIPLTMVSLVAERYVYLGTATFVFIIALFLKNLSKYNFVISIGALLLLVLVYGGRTYIRNNDWRNEETLWQSVERVTPNSFVNYLNMGSLYISRKQFDKAIEQYKYAVKDSPNNSIPYHGLGVAYLYQGHKEKAMYYFEKAIAVNPTYYASYQNLAILYFENSKFIEAETLLKKALTYSPENPELHVNLGILYFKLGRIREARNEFEITLRYDPSNQKALKGLQITGER